MLGQQAYSFSGYLISFPLVSGTSQGVTRFTEERGKEQKSQ